VTGGSVTSRCVTTLRHRHKVTIDNAADDAARKYYEEIPEKDRTGLGVTAVMRAAAKSKHQSFKGQFSKFTTIANPKFGDGFMDEVSLLCFRLFQFPLKYY
jgi:hypothetical protein